MKAHREHRVPLSRRATQILRTALAVRNGSKLVFRSPHGKPLLSDITLPTLLKQQGVAAVPHGFRSSFRDWHPKRPTTTRGRSSTAALAHRVTRHVEAAYARSPLFERRRRLLAE